MSRNWKRTRIKGSVPEEGTRREEQGDLLADAVSGAFMGDEPEPEIEAGLQGPEGQAGKAEDGPGVSDASDGESGSVPASARDEEGLPQPPALDPRLEGEPEPWEDAGSGKNREVGSEHAEGSGEEAAEKADGGPAAKAASGGRSGPDSARGEHALPEPARGEDTITEPIPLTAWEQKMSWAKERAREGRRAEAEELYRELLQENPDSVRARNNLGILLDENGDHQGAVAELSIARQLNPRNGEVLGNLGAALGAMGRYVEAEEALRAAHRLDPSNHEIRANLGILYFRKGLYQQAETELAAVCVRDPDHGTALFYRGEALNRLGRVDEAIEVLSRAVELAPGNPRAYHTLGVLFDKKGLPERAAPMYRKARELTTR